MDPYEVLGITRSATRDQITVAYRRKARQWHPDINKSPEATEQFQRIQLAHDKLTGKVPYVDTTRRTSEAPHASTYRPSYGVFIDTEMLQRIQREALLNLLRALSETPAQRRERERVERVRLIQQERERVARLRLAEKERVERLRAAKRAAKAR